MNAAVFAETVRRHMTSAGYWSFVVLIASAAVFASSFNTPGALWPSLVTLLAIVTGSALIGPEFSTGVLQLIVSRPIGRSVYVLSRAGGVLASVVPAAAAGLTAELLLRILGGGGTVPWQRLLEVFAGALTVSLLAIALLAFLGSITRAYFNVAIYFGVQIALSVGETLVGLLRARARLHGVAIDQLAGVERALIAIGDLLFPDVRPVLDATWLLRVVATAAIALALACAAFRRREVPYSAD